MNSFIEPLEARLAPAGVVTVSVAGGVLTLTSLAAQDSNESLVITGLGDGSFRITPQGGTILRVNGVDQSTARDVGGITGLTANLGKDSDTLALVNCAFTKSVSVNLGTGAFAGNNSLSISNSTIGGTLGITTGDGQDVILFQGTACEVTGAATIKLGAGTDFLITDVRTMEFKGNVTVDGGAGTDTVRLGVANFDVFIADGNFSFIGGAGDDTLYAGAANSFVSASTLQMTDTAGNDRVFLAGAFLFASNLSLQMGPGDNQLTSTLTSIALTRNFQWTSTTGTDTVVMDGTSIEVDGNFSVDMGAGVASLNITPDEFEIGGTLGVKASAAAGVDRDLTIQTGNFVVEGKVTVNAGAGNGELRFYSTGLLHLGAGAAFSSGAGDSRWNVTASAGFISNGAISVTSASTTGYVAVNAYGGEEGFNLISGALTVKGGDEIYIGFNGMITGALNVTTSTNAVSSPDVRISYCDVVGPMNLSLPSLSGQQGYVSLFYIEVAGAVKISTLAGNDRLETTDCFFGSSFTASLGAGADIFNIEPYANEYLAQVRGAFLLQGGAGADTFSIGGDSAGQGIRFHNTVTLDGGADADTYDYGSLASFSPFHARKQLNFP